MKIAIVHDELMRRGGAEQVVLSFHKAFPLAPIFAMAYNQETTYEEFKNCNVITSWFNKLVSSEKWMKRLYFPLGYWAMKRLDVKDYDIVLMSATYCAKYVNISKGTLIIAYCHCPFRLAWYPQSYSEYQYSKGLKRIVFDQVINILRKIDLNYAKRINHYIANTHHMADEIEEKYNLSYPVEVNNPPVKCLNFEISDKTGDYYLVVSRLEYYKKVDLVIEAFNLMGLPLIIVGKGSKTKELTKIAKPNIIFKSGLSNLQISKLYSECKALIFPQHEDYGITPLEANASGRPVIAYGMGGVLETMIPFNGTNEKECTAVFFKSQTKGDLINAIEKFQMITFNRSFIRKHAEKFDETIFINKIKEFVLEKNAKQQILKPIPESYISS